MALPDKAGLAHLAFYLHAAAVVAVAVAGGPLQSALLVPLCATFPATAGVVHRIRRMHRQSEGREADWLGA